MSTSTHNHGGAQKLLGTLVVALVLAGCGSSASTQSQSSSQPASTQASASDPASGTSSDRTTATAAKKSTAKGPAVPNVEIELTSPVKLEPLSARYTCDGANVPMPLSWTKVPAHMAEIDIFIAGLKDTKAGKLAVVWGVTGLKPSLRKFSGHLPAGAIVGRNSLGTNGYSICPPKGSEEEYIAFVDALKQPEPMKPGFDASALLEHLLHTEVSEGRTSIFYKRP
jgi:phosphatidylethanolamine-binding protein (PEBP) family uncharacterized protein